MTQDLREKFERDGYVHVPGIVPPERVRALRADFFPIFRTQSVRVLHDAVLHYPQILDVLGTPQLVQALGTLLGDHFVVPPYSSVTLDGFGLFHTDTTGAELSGQTYHKRRDFRIVTVGIYLQDNNEYGGGIRLAPGSHREPDRYVPLMTWKADVRRRLHTSRVRRALQRLSRGRLYDVSGPFEEHERGIDIPSKAGDATIWDLRIAHRASPKRAEGPVPDGGKLSVFFNCGVNNTVTTDDYMKYVMSIPENEFLRQERPRPARDSARPFVIL
jgi:hypothetical protein